VRIYRDLQSYAPDAGPAVVALGAFDGIHLGHRRILEVAVGRARASGARSLVCTFDPHPLQVLRPGQVPPPISTLGERLEQIEAAGIDATVIVPFTREFASVEPEDFARDVLVGRLHAREVIVGFNHTFGRGARGTPALLESLGPALGFATHVIPPLSVGGLLVSSSRIRDALGAGDVVTAAALLGRPYTIRGPVVRGAGRGRSLGFPTANVSAERPLLVPPGVYAGYAWIDPSARPEVPGQRFKCVLNIGFRPTFGAAAYAIEVHLLDFDGDLYGRRIKVDVVARIRDERRFPDVEALRAQIRRDVGVAATRL
jgi:riboflavin kinase/FMN adenylyltransferase